MRQLRARSRNADVLAAQLADVRALHADAQTRGWDNEIHRHDRVATKLEQHLIALGRPDLTSSPS
jgi:hypothetical protein